MSDPTREPWQDELEAEVGEVRQEFVDNVVRAIEERRAPSLPQPRPHVRWSWAAAAVVLITATAGTVWIVTRMGPRSTESVARLVAGSLVLSESGSELRPGDTWHPSQGPARATEKARVVIDGREVELASGSEARVTLGVLQLETGEAHARRLQARGWQFDSSSLFVALLTPGRELPLDRFAPPKEVDMSRLVRDLSQSLVMALLVTAGVAPVQAHATAPSSDTLIPPSSALLVTGIHSILLHPRPPQPLPLPALTRELIHEPSTVAAQQTEAVVLNVKTLDENGKPVPGAEVLVTAWRWQGGQNQHALLSSGKAQADGTCRLEVGPVTDKASSWLIVTARAPGLAIAARRLQDEMSERPIQLCLLPAESITGRIVDEAGAPVPGARTRVDFVNTDTLPLGLSRPSYVDHSTRSGPDGRFELSALSADWTVYIGVQAKGYAAWHDHWGMTPGRGEQWVTLQSGGVVRGRVVPVDVSLPSGVQVILYPSGLADPLYVPVDADGEFRAEGVAAGTYNVALIDEARPARVVSTVLQNIRVARGETVGPINIEATQGVRLWGTITDAQGKPVNDTWMHAYRDGVYPLLSATIHQDGAYELRLPRGETDINWEGGQFRINITTGESELRHDLVREHRRETWVPSTQEITVTVTDPTGRRVPAWVVGPGDQGWASADAGAQLVLRYTVERHSVPSLPLLAYDAGRKRVGLALASPDQKTLEITVHDAASLEGCVTDEKGVPLADAVVLAGAEEEGPLHTRTRTDNQGFYRFENLPAGLDWPVHAALDGFARHTETVTVSAASQRLDITLQRTPESPREAPRRQ
ncbi:MAG: carboxypeptidase-like regulatory domain-containing protein [Planctomycetota bacterium]